MKTILILLFLLPFTCTAQDWKEYCVTYQGDTLRVGDSVKIVSNSTLETYKYIKPRFNYSDKDWLSYKRHLAFMLGNTYEITDLSRLAINRKKGVYQPLLIIKETHASDYDYGIEYTVKVDSAIIYKVIDLKKK